MSEVIKSYKGFNKDMTCKEHISFLPTGKELIIIIGNKENGS